MTATHTTVDSPLGELTLVAEEGRLTGVYFPHHWYAGDRTRFDLAVAPRGDEFQRRVWDLISAIPYGQTVTYGELARDLGGPVTPKDVGAAVGRNPLSVVVPCHRVVGKDGRLTGYAGGLARKRFLLDLEGASARLY